MTGTTSKPTRSAHRADVREAFGDETSLIPEPPVDGDRVTVLETLDNHEEHGE